MSQIRTHQSKRSKVETTPWGRLLDRLDRRSGKRNHAKANGCAGIFQDRLVFVQFLLTLFEER